MTEGINTFSSLKASLVAWSQRGGSADPKVETNLQRFINLTEESIATKLKLLGVKLVVTGNFIDGQPVYNKPNGWKSTISWRVLDGENIVLYQRTPDYVRMFWPDVTAKADPKYYADIDYTHWLVAPTPNGTLSFEVEYYEYPPNLSDVNESNWFINNFSRAMLYGSLKEMYEFLRDTPVAMYWKAQFDEAMGDVRSEDLNIMVSESQRKPK
jgi:hypothetical protein